MRIKVNGDDREVTGGVTLARLLQELNMEPRTLAIEHNGEFLENDRLAGTVLNEGDRLEIAHFVGGG